MSSLRHSLIPLLAAAGALAADWPQWRGPNRDGISSETGLLEKWPDTGPPLAWKTGGLGAGYSSVAVARGRVYTQGQRGDTQHLIALDSETGKKLWEIANGRGYRERRGDGPRSVPTVDEDIVFALAADGSLLAADARSGKKIWSVNILEAYEGETPHWGISESPLVDGEHLIVSPGGNGAAVVALDKKTGRLVWKSQDDRAAYSSPVLAQVGNLRTILSFSERGALGLRADNGQLLWRYDKVANQTANIATPIFARDHAFYSSDYGTGCALLRLRAEGSGVKASEVYFSREMKNHYSSSVLIGEHLYGFSSSILTAMKFLTGEVAWRDRSVGKGSVTYAGRHLYVLGENGVVALVEASPAAYKEKSRFTISKSDRPTWAPPVISEAKLFLRDQDNLYCYSIKAGK